MNPTREEGLFELVLQKPAEKRGAFLDTMCDGDAALRARLEELLASQDQTEGVLAESAPTAKATTKPESADAPEETVGQVIGRYKVLQKIGEGGCGVVYMAEQQEPVRRRVALKVIKLGMDTKAVIARFEAERQALALMDHPNIAKVLDAGATEAGRPFFVMELVRGIKFTEYCDQNHLDTRSRLELFIQICQAIQHAHQKGIIHRDIKPSNILVTLHDGVPVPKVIDFGIAKATTDQRLTEKTLFTAYEQFIGTPAYMSPEQAEMSGLDVDTRSDIYSLGVLLYELLTGRTPFDAQELMSQGIDAMRRTIREKEPMRPSTKVHTLQGEELTTTAKRHGVDVPKLVSQLRGDLDWIVMKCLEKDRTRRYETANGLAMDLKRHLNNEPIVARPPSKLYEFQKTFRRHKVVFGATAGIIVALTAGISLAIWQAVRARRAEALALRSRGEAEKLSNFMLEDFYTQLEPSGQFEIVARLARQALSYFDNLPASLRTAETERNRAMAQARLALIITKEKDAKIGLPMASEALASLERMRNHGDHSEETIFATGLACLAEARIYVKHLDPKAAQSAVQRGIASLKPLATSPEGSGRVKLLYAQSLDWLSGLQPPEQGVATAEEALQVEAGLGALDPSGSNFTEASAYADTADSEAQELLAIGRLDDAQRLEKQAQSLAEGVLARRPGDLHAMFDVVEAGQLLAMIAAEQFHDDQALQLISEARRAGENYLRFNPSDSDGWHTLDRIYALEAAISFRLGHVSEAVQKASAATEGHPDQASVRSPNPPTRVFIFSDEQAAWEAQRGNRAAAEKALQEARFFIQALTSRNPSGIGKVLLEADLDSGARIIKMIFGESADAETTAKGTFSRLEKLERENHDLSVLGGHILYLKDASLEDSVCADLNLARYAEAESAARTLLSLPTNKDLDSLLPLLMTRGDRPWAQVLLAQAEAGQGRKEEALKTLEPALAQYRQRQAQGASDVPFRQRFARALCVQALAEASDAGGLARRRDELHEAERVLQGLTDEARQLHDSKELLSWIAAARNDSSAKLNLVR